MKKNYSVAQLDYFLVVVVGGGGVQYIFVQTSRFRTDMLFIDYKPGSKKNTSVEDCRTTFSYMAPCTRAKLPSRWPCLSKYDLFWLVLFSFS